MHSLFEVEDPRGRKVVCTDERWFGHVLVDKPFMKKHFDEVRETVSHPDSIYEDAQFEGHQVYYREHPNAPWHVKVVVLFTSDGVGTLWTAHPSDAAKPGEKLIWQRPEDS